MKTDRNGVDWARWQKIATNIAMVFPNSLRRKGLDATFLKIPKEGMREKWER